MQGLARLLSWQVQQAYPLISTPVSLRYILAGKHRIKMYSVDHEKEAEELPASPAGRAEASEIGELSESVQQVKHEKVNLREGMLNLFQANQRDSAALLESEGQGPLLVGNNTDKFSSAGESCLESSHEKTNSAAPGSNEKGDLVVGEYDSLSLPGPPDAFVCHANNSKQTSGSSIAPSLRLSFGRGYRDSVPPTVHAAKGIPVGRGRRKPELLRSRASGRGHRGQTNTSADNGITLWKLRQIGRHLGPVEPDLAEAGLQEVADADSGTVGHGRGQPTPGGIVQYNRAQEIKHNLDYFRGLQAGIQTGIAAYPAGESSERKALEQGMEQAADVDSDGVLDTCGNVSGRLGVDYSERFADADEEGVFGTNPSPAGKAGVAYHSIEEEMDTRTHWLSSEGIAAVREQAQQSAGEESPLDAGIRQVFVSPRGRGSGVDSSPHTVRHQDHIGQGAAPFQYSMLASTSESEEEFPEIINWKQLRYKSPIEGIPTVKGAEPVTGGTMPGELALHKLYEDLDNNNDRFMELRTERTQRAKVENAEERAETMRKRLLRNLKREVALEAKLADLHDETLDDIFGPDHARKILREHLEGLNDGLVKLGEQPIEDPWLARKNKERKLNGGDYGAHRFQPPWQPPPGTDDASASSDKWPLGSQEGRRMTMMERRLAARGNSDEGALARTPLSSREMRELDQKLSTAKMAPPWVKPGSGSQEVHASRGSIEMTAGVQTSEQRMTFSDRRQARRNALALLLHGPDAPVWGDLGRRRRLEMKRAAADAMWKAAQNDPDPIDPSFAMIFRQLKHNRMMRMLPPSEWVEREVAEWARQGIWPERFNANFGTWKDQEEKARAKELAKRQPQPKRRSLKRDRLLKARREEEERASYAYVGDLRFRILPPTPQKGTRSKKGKGTKAQRTEEEGVGTFGWVDDETQPIPDLEAADHEVETHEWDGDEELEDTWGDEESAGAARRQHVSTDETPRRHRRTGAQAQTAARDGGGKQTPKTQEQKWAEYWGSDEDLPDFKGTAYGIEAEAKRPQKSRPPPRSKANPKAMKKKKKKKVSAGAHFLVRAAPETRIKLAKIGVKVKKKR